MCLKQKHNRFHVLKKNTWQCSGHKGGNSRSLDVRVLQLLLGNSSKVSKRSGVNCRLPVESQPKDAGKFAEALGLQKDVIKFNYFGGRDLKISWNITTAWQERY